MIDNFVQKRRSDLEESSSLDIYRHVKQGFEFETYLDIPKYRKYRSVLTQIRLSSHRLRIETGRYGPNRLDRSERICQFCESGEPEDEYHFILTCEKYGDLRVRYISRYYRIRPSVNKFVELLQANRPIIINNLCYYIFNAFKRRNNVVNEE